MFCIISYYIINHPETFVKNNKNIQITIHTSTTDRGNHQKYVGMWKIYRNI